MIQPDQHVVIIGNGIAGVTLAQRVRARSHARITLISSESATHFSRPALMYVYMGHLRHQDILPYPDWYWREQNLEMVHDRVEQVDFDRKQLKLQKGEPVRYDKLVLATGSCPAFYDWPGQHLKGVQGLVTLQDLESMERQTQSIKQAVVAGGGLIGIEMAEMLKSRGIHVTMLVRDKLFWHSTLPQQEAGLVTNHIRSHGITLRLEEELEEIIGDGNDAVKAVRTKNGDVIPCQFAGIATGVKPNVAFLRNTALELDTGVLVNEFFETNMSDVYAIGDCAQFRNPQPGAPALEQLWYTARLHGEALASTLTGQRTAYNRGPWFNSAKFLDIEYQTYGQVPSELTPKYESLYWEHPERSKAIRLVYDAATAQLAGINLLGVRYRHDLCHHWLQQNYLIHQVMQELPAANFDTEFFQRYEQELLLQYHQRFPNQTRQNTRSNWWKLRQRFGLSASGSFSNC